ncbi:competence type IV pilus minor pilin ComGD [Lentibacillus sediminis]|uniref:competence type IV pilus minor pilin ComGD n=1 Tax=Lentibacillus sediminis TaxID=1940529 RepID=UPI0013046978|nr:competence type IV pilus minor pilin ComGD [Lentibacillus sediminis]
MNNKKGFALIEVVLVLGIIAVMLLLVTPINSSSLEKHRIDQFLETLTADVLHVQHLSAVSSQIVKIQFSSDRYKIFNGIDLLTTRVYPQNVSIENNTDMKEISFSQTGTIREAGQLKIKTADSEYTLVFQPGKGRFYIDES